MGRRKTKNQKNKKDDHNEQQEQSTTTDKDVQAWETIISELIVKATDKSVQSCLRTYDPKDPSENIIQTLRKKCKKEQLKKTFKFLGGNSVDSLDAAELAEHIVVKVQNLFPDICQICQEVYCVKLEDKHFLACGSCGQEVHKQCYLKELENLNLITDDKLQIMLFSIPGFYYLCASCESSTINENLINKNYDDGHVKTSADNSNQDKQMSNTEEFEIQTVQNQDKQMSNTEEFEIQTVQNTPIPSKPLEESSFHEYVSPTIIFQNSSKDEDIVLVDPAEKKS